jgi:hypothetical protein
MANDNTITRPELWTLILGLESAKLQYMLYTDAQSDSLITGEVKLDLAGKTYLKAVEDAVYDTPLLLDDYKCVKVLYRARHFVLLPQEFADNPDDAASALEASLPESDGQTCVCAMPQLDACIAFEMPDDVANFLQRTFNSPPVFQHLYPLCRHFAGTCKDSGVTRMFVNFHSSAEMDIVVFDKTRLAFANSFSFASLADAQYFTLHIWHSLKLNVHTDEILVIGDKDSRNAIMTSLRRYVSYVMPAIFPAAAMRLGDNAVAAPFELLTLALCE